MKKFLSQVLLIVILQVTHGQQITDQMCNGRMDGFLFYDPASCHMFVECQGGQAVRQSCPSGTLFNLDLFYCTAAHTVTCGSRDNPHRVVEHVETRISAPVTGGHHVV
jgi:Chitin binding Peritrophin-A domain